MDKEIVLLFVEKEYSVSRIAKELNKSAQEVRDILLKNYYPTLYRTREQTLRMHDAMKSYIDNPNRSIADVAREFQMGNDNLSRNLKCCNVTVNDRLHKAKFNENIFDSIDTEEKAYWLGFIYADGFIETPNANMKYKFEICLSDVDYNHLQKFNTFMGHVKTNIRRDNYIDKTTGKTKYRARWIIANKHLWETLNNIGCTPKKSLTLKFPNIDKNLVRHFIRGYFDGDGCIGCYGAHKLLHCNCIGTEDMLTKMFTLLNFIPTLFHNSKHHELTKQFTLVSSKAKQFFDYIYNDCNIYLDRKYNKYLLLCRP